MEIAQVGEVKIDMKAKLIHISLYDVNMEGANTDYFKYVVLTHAKRIIQEEMDKYEGQP